MNFNTTLEKVYDSAKEHLISESKLISLFGATEFTFPAQVAAIFGNDFCYGC